MNDVKNLWSKKIGTETVEAPKTLMIEQANLLGNMTQNRIIGEVKSAQIKVEDKNYLQHTFYIVCPTLGNYSFPLFRVHHELAIYPLKVYSYVNEKWSDDLDEKQFNKKLEEILSNDETGNIINGLLAQAV